MRAGSLPTVWAALVLSTPVAPALHPVATPSGAVVMSEFLYDRAPFASAHASTIAEAREGLVAAWFGGTREGSPDVSIWISRRLSGGWSPPVAVADGVQATGTRYACWNPVLFQPSTGPLVLFYKVGPSPRGWWAEARTSDDAGRTWSAPVTLPPGILGPIRAKPVELPGGAWLAGSSTEHAGWVVHMELFQPPRGPLGAADLARAEAWHAVGPVNDAGELAAIQPTILAHSATRVQILCRSRQGVVTEAWSEDAGRTWSAMRATSLPNPSAGIDALPLSDGRFLLVYNPSATSREPLDVALSTDGKAWRRGLTLEQEPGEHSYPAVIQTRDRLVHVTYTWRRERIKHVVLDPARIGR